MLARRARPSAPRGEMTRGDKWVPALLIGLVAGYVALWWNDPIGAHIWSPLGASMMHGDSPSFFLGRPSSRYRWMGYPVFLQAVEAVFGTVGAAPRVQLVLMGAAVLFLCFAVLRALRAPWLALALAASILGLSAVVRFYAYLLSEGLFVPLICALAGVVAQLVRRPTALWAAAGAVLCGLAVVVRPAGIAMLGLWPILAWLLWPRCVGRAGRLAAAVAVPLVVVFAAETVVWRSVHGWAGERPSIVDRALFAKAVLAPEMPGSGTLNDVELAEFLAGARRTTAPLRDLIAAAPEWRMGAIMLRNAESKVEGVSYGLLRDPIRKLAERRRVSADRLLGDVGWPAMLAMPGAWTANAATHWLSLWTYYSINDAAFARRYRAYVESHTDLSNAKLFEDANVIRSPAVAAKPVAVALLARSAGGVALLCTLITVVAALWQRLRRSSRRVDDGLVVALAGALLTHSYVLVTALFNGALLRFIVVTWPLQALCVLLLAHWAWRRWRTWRGSPRG